MLPYVFGVRYCSLWNLELAQEYVSPRGQRFLLRRACIVSSVRRLMAVLFCPRVLESKNESKEVDIQRLEFWYQTSSRIHSYSSMIDLWIGVDRIRRLDVCAVLAGPWSWQYNMHKAAKFGSSSRFVHALKVPVPP
jgi:hypothetical protein